MAQRNLRLGIVGTAGLWGGKVMWVKMMNTNSLVGWFWLPFLFGVLWNSGWCDGKKQVVVEDLKDPEESDNVDDWAESIRLVWIIRQNGSHKQLLSPGSSRVPQHFFQKPPQNLPSPSRKNPSIPSDRWGLVRGKSLFDFISALPGYSTLIKYFSSQVGRVLSPVFTEWEWRSMKTWVGNKAFLLHVDLVMSWGLNKVLLSDLIISQRESFSVL